MFSEINNPEKNYQKNAAFDKNDKSERECVKWDSECLPFMIF